MKVNQPFISSQLMKRKEKKVAMDRIFDLDVLSNVNVRACLE